MFFSFPRLSYKALSFAFIAGSLQFASASSERTSINSIYGELLGPALLYSVNYERLVTNDLGVRVGFSYMSFSSSASGQDIGEGSAGISSATIPLTASYLGISSGAHALELGAGATLIFASGKAEASGITTSGSGMGTLGNVLVGYRVHPVNGGFQFRVGFSGLYGSGAGASQNDPTAFGFMPWAYISLGMCF